LARKRLRVGFGGSEVRVTSHLQLRGPWGRDGGALAMNGSLDIELDGPDAAANQ
jgi:hypothetical protein